MPCAFLSSVRMDPREKDTFPSEILPVVIIGKKLSLSLFHSFSLSESEDKIHMQINVAPQVL